MGSTKSQLLSASLALSSGYGFLAICVTVYNYILYGVSGVDLVSDQSVHQRAMIDETLNFVVGRSWYLEETDFFEELVTHLGDALGVTYALCGAVASNDDRMIETVALYDHGGIVPNVQYNLDGAPCNDVVGHQFCYFANGIQEQFPEDIMLQDLNVESYAGISLWASDGKTPLGIITVLHDEPMVDEEFVRTLLQIVAVRAGAELERRMVMRQLRNSEQRFADFAVTSSDWFWETDHDLQFSFFSDQFEKLVGIPAEDLIGKTRADVGAPGASPEALAKLLDDMENQRPFRDFEHHRVLPNGDVVYVAISGVPAFDRTGAFVGYRGTGQDISHYKKIQHEVIKSRDEAQKANQAKSEFLAHMSHELRTPLNAITGFSQILASELFGPHVDHKYQEYAKDIHQAGSHLLSIINDVLDLSKIEAGESQIEASVFAVHDVLDECIKLVAGKVPEMGSRFRVDYAGHDNELLADERLFRQTILNIVSNASKFTPDDGVISVSLSVDDAHRTLVQVKDTGEGIPEGDLEKILEPFGQARANVQVAHEGTGLGLPLSSKIMEMQGGSLDIISHSGEGTTVTLTFPNAPVVQERRKELRES